MAAQVCNQIAGGGGGVAIQSWKAVNSSMGPEGPMRFSLQLSAPLPAETTFYVQMHLNDESDVVVHNDSFTLPAGSVGTVYNAPSFTDLGITYGAMYVGCIASTSKPIGGVPVCDIMAVDGQPAQVTCPTAWFTGSSYVRPVNGGGPFPNLQEAQAFAAGKPQVQIENNGPGYYFVVPISHLQYHETECPLE